MILRFAFKLSPFSLYLYHSWLPRSLNHTSFTFNLCIHVLSVLLVAVFIFILIITFSLIKSWLSLLSHLHSLFYLFHYELDSLKNHSRTHTGKKPYRCEECDIPFAPYFHNSFAPARFVCTLSTISSYKPNMKNCTPSHSV